MTRWWRRRSLRTRLTLWHTATLALVLATFAAAVFLFVRHVLVDELDRQLHDDFEAAEEHLESPSSGAIRLADAPHADGDQPELWADLWTLEGRPLFHTPLVDAAPISGAPSVPSAQYRFGSARAETGEHFRTVTGIPSVQGQRVMLRVARSAEPMRHELRELLVGIGFLFPLAVVLAGIGGARLARESLRPLDRMAERARTLTAERLHDRLPVENPDDELGRLATVFNDTLTRLEGSFEQLRRFTADASHELRTPLTAIRSVGEVGLGERVDTETYRDIIGSMLEEADRLTRLVDTLLTLSRADAGELALNREPADLSLLVQDVVSTLSVLAEEKRVSITVHSSARIEAPVDRLLLSEAVMNLIDNAVKYSPEGAEVTIELQSTAADVQIDVIDRGPGIQKEHHQRVFDRFYRVDKGRARRLGGTGLGLSIAQWVVRAHGGSLELHSSGPDGSVFRITLPLRSS